MESLLSMIGGGLVRGRLVLLGMVGCIVGLSLILDISDIAGVVISNIVGNNLDPAIRKIDTVFTIGGVTITVLVSSKV